MYHEGPGEAFRGWDDIDHRYLPPSRIRKSEGGSSGPPQPSKQDATFEWLTVRTTPSYAMKARRNRGKSRDSSPRS